MRIAPLDDAEVELSLLSPTARDQFESTADTLFVHDDIDLDEESVKPVLKNRPATWKEKKGMILLTCLFLSQGVPLGLVTGSLPFLLRSRLTYSQLATFSLSAYPYSLKLLWSPLVDALYIPSIGRRKSWLMPLQLLSGTIMLVLSFYGDHMLDNAVDYLYTLTAAFTFLIMTVATQDIAVDGWALTLLSERHKSYIPTCQTIGLSTGSLLSYTGFLAFNSETFAEKHHIPRLTLGAYCMFCAVLSYALTIWLLFEKEQDVEEEGDMSLKAIYLKMWEVMKLRHVQTLLILLLVAKIGFQADSAVSTLKMVEKGFSKEDLSLTVLISFPFQITGGWLAGRWSKGERPLRAWMHAYWPAFALVLLSTLTVYAFPHPPIPVGWYVFIILQSIVSSLVMTVQFGGMTAFHTRISDPVAGGTYMTLFATFNNLGLMWPRYFVLKGVDLFTVATCSVPSMTTLENMPPASCVTRAAKGLCTAAGGTCTVERDGYYVMSAICIGAGFILLVFFMIPTARRLQTIPPKEWRVRSS
ncbi:acetyl-coenzyme A transporter 1-domain-containing protein [Fomitopsis betulina]|nr:acetyl-coenzyme A transporter 1-domain-containing protein [Fomitopsis betulina]